jgi:hypothetical protein
VTAINVGSPNASTFKYQNSTDSLVFVQMHAPDGGCVAVQCVNTCSSFAVPDLEGAVRAARDDRVPLHLRRPDAAGVAHKGAKALTSVGGPNLREEESKQNS